MVSQRELEQVVEQVNGIVAGLVKRIKKLELEQSGLVTRIKKLELEQANTTKATKSKEKS